MSWDWRKLGVIAALSMVMSACGGDTVATTTSSSTLPSTTPTSSTATGPTPTTHVTTTSTTGDEEVGALLVVGDWGSGTLPQGAVAGAMMRYAEENDVEAILTTGDNFYSDDADFLIEPYEWAITGGIPFWIAWGNHDIETETRIEAIEKNFGDPPRWTVHDWGSVDVVILDSTQQDSEVQVEFLIEALSGSDRPTIVVTHHPPYSCGAHGGSQAILDDWVSQFDDDVFLVLSGHEHNYQRFKTNEVTYVVTGGGGATLTELGSCSSDEPDLVHGESVHHFLELEQSEEQLVVSAIDVNGDALDEFSLALP